MKKYSAVCIVFGVLAVSVWGCKKTCPANKDVKQPTFSYSPSSPIPADNTTITMVKVIIPADATADRQTLVVTADSGIIVGSTNNQITLTCVLDPTNNCQLYATFNFVSPSVPGVIHFTTQIGGLAYIDTVSAYRLKPVSIQLTPASSTVMPNFGSEVVITGKVLNQYGNGVGQGYRVRFSEYWADSVLTPYTGGNPPRVLQDTTDANGYVSMTYSPGFVTNPNDTLLFVKATVLMPDNSTLISPSVIDSIRLYIH